MLFFSSVVFDFPFSHPEDVLKKLVVVAAVVSPGVALAADCPADVQGSWIAAANKDPKACNVPMQSIQKSNRVNAVDASCSVNKVSGSTVTMCSSNNVHEWMQGGSGRRQYLCRGNK